jgi:CubicO group peptidase (beta-lactamase class C family)
MKSFMIKNAMVCICTLLIFSSRSSAQKPVDGYWLGELNASRDYLTYLRISGDGDKLSVAMDNPNEPRDMNLAAADLVAKGSKLSFKLPQIRGVFEGVISPDNNTITVQWLQYGYITPLEFKKDSAATGSAIAGKWSAKRTKSKKTLVQLFKITKKDDGEYQSYFHRLDDVGQKVDILKTIVKDDSVYLFEKSQGVAAVISKDGNFLEGQAKIDGMTLPYKLRRVNPDTIRSFHARPFVNGRPAEYIYTRPSETGDGWKTAVTADTAFLSRTKNMMQAILNEELLQVSGIAVAKGGKLIMEEYFYQNGYNTKIDIGEMTGSVTSAITGIAIDNEFIDNTNEKVFSYFANDYTLSPEEAGKTQITIQHLLNMNSGLAATDFEPGAKERLFKSKDWTKFALSLPLANPPGQAFSYYSGNLIILGTIVERATKQTFADYAQNNFFGPLGIKQYDWDYSQKGEAITSQFLRLTLRDATKIGQLYLNNGKWEGKQIISEKWVKESTLDLNRPDRDESKLKNMWWNTTAELDGKVYEMFFSNGFAGHKIFVIPSLDVVFVVLGKLRDGAEGRIINEFLLPAVTKLQ